MSVQERLDALSAASDYAAEQEKLGEYMRQVSQTQYDQISTFT
jgi:hypothetical protein